MNVLKDDQLFQQLVNETQTKITEEEGNVLSFDEYFKKQSGELNNNLDATLEIYLRKNHIAYFDLLYNSKGNFFEINVGNERIDFPSNWSIFKIFTNIINSKENLGVFVLEKNNNNDDLITVLKQVIPDIQTIVLSKEDHKYLFITLNTTNQESASWLVKYFDNGQSEIKAA